MHEMASLLSLPLEVRLQIYAFLLRAPDDHNTMPTLSFQLHPAILSTCIQVHDEALPVLYADNLFVAHHGYLASNVKLRTSMPRVQPFSAGRPLIRRWLLRINLANTAYWTHRKALSQDFSGVDELRLFVVYFLVISSEKTIEALRRFAGIRGVRKVSILGMDPLDRKQRARVDEYIEWLTMAMTSPIGSEVEDSTEWIRKRRLLATTKSASA